MRKLLIALIAFAFLPSAATWAQEGHGHRGGDGGGWGNGGGNGNGGGGSWGDQDNHHAKKARRGGRPKGGNNAGTLNGNPSKQRFNGAGNGFSGNGIHHFNRKNGTAPGNSNHFQSQSVNKGNFASPSHFNHPTQVSPKLQKMGINHVPQPMNRTSLLNADRQHSAFTQPRVGPQGAALHASVIAPSGNNRVFVQNHMASITHNTTFTAQVNVYNTQETRVNHYYWHTWNGTNYCHYYDNWGYHWYGWYWGGNCFWSRWYGNNWWWYDPVAFRWCYWYDGGWWWQDPYHVNVVYVYNNGQYVQGNSEGATAPETSPSSTGGPSTSPNLSTAVSYASKDGTRSVKIVNGDAFLYDTVQGETDNKPVFLSDSAKDVKFSTDKGKPLQIMVVLTDGSSQIFDSDGNPVQGNGGGGN